MSNFSATEKCLGVEPQCPKQSPVLLKSPLSFSCTSIHIFPSLNASISPFSPSSFLKIMPAAAYVQLCVEHWHIVTSMLCDSPSVPKPSALTWFSSWPTNIRNLTAKANLSDVFYITDVTVSRPSVAFPLFYADDSESDSCREFKLSSVFPRIHFNFFAKEITKKSTKYFLPIKKTQPLLDLHIHTPHKSLMNQGTENHFWRANFQEGKLWWLEHKPISITLTEIGLYSS